MRSRLRPTVWALCVLCLLAAATNSTRAATITTNSYVEGPAAGDDMHEWSFRWSFWWNRVQGTVGDPISSPPNLDKWWPQAGFQQDWDDDGVRDDLLINARHLDGPHDVEEGDVPFDIGQGALGVIIYKNALDLPIGSDSSWILLDSTTAVHQTSGAGSHYDRYELYYSRWISPTGVNFLVTGQHSEQQVPEPSSVMLAAIGAVCCLRLWSRAKRRAL